MTTLYSDLAEVYEAMYQTFINYGEEFGYYSKLLETANCRSVVEIGCGSGNLVSFFKDAGYQYTGLDLSAEMLDIARSKHPAEVFIQADMRKFELPALQDSAIMTGRTISYLLENTDVIDCFHAVRNCVKPGGLFCFDFIDASRFIPKIVATEKITHHAAYGDRRFSRDSFWNKNISRGWAFDWQSIYYEETTNSRKKIGEDFSTIRTFTRDEITLFLKLAGFEVLACFDRPSYAFETFVIMAH